jgi:hypothetical protein
MFHKLPKCVGYDMVSPKHYACLCGRVVLYLLPSLNVDLDETYPCPVCHKEFPSISAVKSHINNLKTPANGPHSVFWERCLCNLCTTLDGTEGGKNPSSILLQATGNNSSSNVKPACSSPHTQQEEYQKRLEEEHTSKIKQEALCDQIKYYILDTNLKCDDFYCKKILKGKEGGS